MHTDKNISEVLAMPTAVAQTALSTVLLEEEIRKLIQIGAIVKLLNQFEKIGPEKLYYTELTFRGTRHSFTHDRPMSFVVGPDGKMM